MLEVLQRDPPQKSHLVDEKVDESTVVTQCGLTFEQPNSPITTFKFDPEEPAYARTYRPPVPAGRCKNCSWDEVDC